MEKRVNKRKQQKKKRTGWTIFILVASLLVSAALVWLGVNDWDIDKSLYRIGISSHSVDSQFDKESDNGAEEESNDFSTNDKYEQPGEDLREPLPPKPAPPIKETPKIDAGGYIEGQSLPNDPTYIQGILIASKKYPLPSHFAPGENAEARAAFEEMAAEAKKSGISLIAFSTYRSFEYQTSLYERYVARDGKEAADRYSARPGYSEHQTGLAFDIGEVGQESHWASASFGDTAAGKWIGDHAHRYGFILRYPLGKEHQTGYMHESWHFRYVGIEIATDIYQRDITLEEYLGID